MNISMKRGDTGYTLLH